jgi:lysine-N-methylase
MGPRLREFVTIYPAANRDDNYARIVLSGTSCPFLSDGLCGVQNKLGEQYLSNVCAKFPRQWAAVDDVLQRSLDISCPEAARLLLLDPEPMEFDDDEGPLYGHPLGELAELTTDDEASSKRYRYFGDIRGFIIGLLQHRPYSIGKRVTILGALVEQLEQLQEAGQKAQTPECLQWFANAIEQDLLDGAIQSHQPKPVVQLGILLELIVMRLKEQFTAQRFLDCYREFKDGIEWMPESSMEEIGARYAAAAAQYYAPFLAAHGHILEHYLVHYVFATHFPLGAQKIPLDPSAQPVDSMRERCLLLMTFYGLVQAMLIGAAAFQRRNSAPRTRFG